MAFLKSEADRAATLRDPAKDPIPTKVYIIPFTAILLLLIGGSIYFISMFGSLFALLFGWIIFSCVIVANLLFAINFLSNRRKFESEFAIVQQNPQYLTALHNLVTKSKPETFYQKSIKRRIKRIESRQQKLEIEYPTTQKLQ